MKLCVLTALLCVDQRIWGAPITSAAAKKQIQSRKCDHGRRKYKLTITPTTSAANAILIHIEPTASYFAARTNRSMPINAAAPYAIHARLKTQGTRNAATIINEIKLCA